MSDIAQAGRASGFAFFTFPSAVTLHATAYRADIDGLRAVAVLSVVIGHFWPAVLPGGYVGVDVFFVISGFLITQILTRELAQGRFDLLAFYQRRARRLFPALFTVLAVTLMAAYMFLLPSDLVAMLRALLATVFFSANLLFWQQSINYFGATEALNNPLLHLWSLGVEEQFYLFFPWVLVATLAYAARRGRDALRWLRWGLLAAALANLALAGVVNERNTSAAFYLSPLRAWEFLAGALAALWPAGQDRPRWWRELLATVSLVVLLACMALYSAHTRFPGWAAVPPVLAAAFLLRGGGHGVARVLAGRLPVGVGLISYSLYLWHWPVLVLSRQQQGLQASVWVDLLMLAVAVLLSVLTWRYVEQPWRRPAAQRPRRGPAWSVAAVVCLVCAGAVGLAARGFESRVPALALGFDKVRHAPLPFKDCPDRASPHACVLGDHSAAPQMLLWGDSHLLAWAPVLDRVMADARRSAVMASHLACAPLLGLSNTQRHSCAASSQEVWRHLQEHPEIRTVMLAAYWSHYFRPESPSLAMDEQGRTLGGLEAARLALRLTVEQLLASGREVVLVGPVPSYAFDVPQVLALHAWHGKPMPVFTVADQARQQDFWRSLPAAPPGQLRVIDPTPWFCGTGECALQAQGQALYRDEQHLSPWGALWVQRQLALALDMLPSPGQP